MFWQGPLIRKERLAEKKHEPYKYIIIVVENHVRVTAQEKQIVLLEYCHVIFSFFQ